MKVSKIKAPVEIIIVIADREKSEHASAILEAHAGAHNLIFRGKGTAQSDIANIFGFGIIEREIVIGFIDVDYSEKALITLNEELKLYEPHNGIAMTVPISSIGNNVLDMLGIKY